MSNVARKNYRQGFTTVGNEMFHDKELSLRDRGLLLTMFSLPDNWRFSIEGLAQIVPEGKDAIKTSIDNLEKLGYLKRSQKRDENGKMSDAIYDFFDYRYYDSEDKEEPATVKPLTENPLTDYTGETQSFTSSEPMAENPLTVKPTAENPAEYNNINNKSKIYYKNNKIKNIRKEYEYNSFPSFSEILDGQSASNVLALTQSQNKNEFDSFVKPTIEDITDYISQHNLQVDPKIFFEYFENTGWRHNSGKYAGKLVKNWKNTLLCWHTRKMKDEQNQSFNCQKSAQNKLTWQEQQRLTALRKAIGMFDPVSEADEYNNIERQIEELEGRCA